MGVVQVSPQTKTGKRTVVMNELINSVKYHLNKGVKLRNEQIKEHNKMVEEGTLPRWRKIQVPMDLLPEPDADTLLMANPFGKDMKPYTDETIRQKLDSVLGGLDFYQTSNFTLHSLRSTHITHALLRGMDVRKVADNVGNSQSEIERAYYTLNNLLNIEELGFFRQKLEKESLLSGEH